MNRILLGVAALALIIISWVIVLNSKSNSERQADLISQAEELIDLEIYKLAAPLLEEASEFNAAYTSLAEERLKFVYLQMIEQSGYKRKYIELLEKQTGRKDASSDSYFELANFYLMSSKYEDAYATLRDGIAKTGSSDLITLYESCRYEFRMGYDVYDDVSAVYGNTVGVCIDGLWGLADSEGMLLIPCEYEKISTYSAGRVVVQKNGVIFAVDIDNNRIAVPRDDSEHGYPGKVTDFGNFANDRLPLLINGKWYRSTGEFELGRAVFDWIGMHTDGYASALSDGKWGVINRDADWVIPAQYDEIIMDELGQSYGQGAVFVRKGSSIYLYVNGTQLDEQYEDAKPFGDEGYAAVKKGGLWGFVDTSGNIVIPCQFEDALSFGQHLAAVKLGEFWGYINVFGEPVIEPTFLQAKSFGAGSAPVLTERGWQFITLREYTKGVGL